MKRPQDFPKALWAVTIAEIVSDYLQPDQLEAGRPRLCQCKAALPGLTLLVAAPLVRSMHDSPQRRVRITNSISFADCL